MSCQFHTGALNFKAHMSSFCSRMPNFRVTDKKKPSEHVLCQYSSYNPFDIMNKKTNWVNFYNKAIPQMYSIVQNVCLT